MTFKAGYYLFAAAIFAAGCAQEEIPSDDADAWEVTAEDNTKPATNADATSEKTATEDPAASKDIVATVKGSSFRIDNTTGTKNIQGGTFRAAHYFAASAPVELKTSVTLVETHLEGQNRDGATPVIGMLIESTSGKYRSFNKDERPIDGKQILKDQFEIGPGNYTIRISYYKDTVGQKRPQIIIDKIIFRNVK